MRSPALAAEKVRRYHNTRNAKIGHRLFVKTARARSTARLDGVRVHTVEDLYDLDAKS